MTTTIERTQELSPPAIDMEAVGVFLNKVLNDMSGAIVSTMCYLGDRLQLFRCLTENGPVTSREFAALADINERYAREWLSTLASAGYIEYDPATQRFTLPPAHALVLAQEGGPMFMGGGHQQLIGLLEPLDQLICAFRQGGGVPQQSYSETLRSGMERMSATWFEHLLVQQWIPIVPDIKAKLQSGAQVADVGCGSGQALIKLAQEFPRSKFVGYDNFEDAITHARVNAEVAGVADRVSFEHRDIRDGLPSQYDLITTFDSTHDFTEPHASFRAIHQALRPKGTYLLLEMNCSNRLEKNVGPVGTILYGTSVLYNLPVSLAGGGYGLGTMGLPEPTLQALCTDAGFKCIRRLPIENPFNALYEVKP